MRAGRAAALTGLVEGDVAVLADTAEEELDAAVLLDLFFVFLALLDQVLRVPVQDVHLGRRDVDCAHAEPRSQYRSARKELSGSERDGRTYCARRIRGT